ncbi:MAG: hypothetical protein IPJ19_05905 [Planctomycetes bacterium]|nr:hypothetical protein [Planctomycetota bacterium]
MQLALNRHRLASLAALLVLVTTALVFSVSALTPPVPTVWHVDVHATGSGNTGLDWTNAFNTATALDDAILAASPGDSLWVADGSYVPSNPTDGFLITKQLLIYGGFDGGEGSVATRAGLFRNTILDGTTTMRVITVSGVTPVPVVIDGFQVTRGHASGGIGGANGEECSRKGRGSTSRTCTSSTTRRAVRTAEACTSPGRLASSSA